jgi:hypothetical protein
MRHGEARWGRVGKKSRDQYEHPVEDLPDPDLYLPVLAANGWLTLLPRSFVEAALLETGLDPAVPPALPDPPITPLVFAAAPPVPDPEF